MIVVSCLLWEVHWGGAEPAGMLQGMIKLNNPFIWVTAYNHIGQFLWCPWRL